MFVEKRFQQNCFNGKKMFDTHKLSLRVCMFETSFNIDVKNRDYLDFLYDGLKDTIKKMKRQS